MSEEYYHQKYLKYKQKYLQLKNMKGGGNEEERPVYTKAPKLPEEQPIYRDPKLPKKQPVYTQAPKLPEEQSYSNPSTKKNSKCSNKRFRLNKMQGNTRLRFQNKTDDPDQYEIIDGTRFQGDVINRDDILKYPCGEKIKVGDKEYVFVMSVDDPNIIGYVNSDYIEQDKQSDKEIYKLKNDYRTITLRTRPENNDPNDYRFEYLKGKQIYPTNKLIFPCGKYHDIEYVIVQKENIPSIIGYINKDYLEEI